MINFIPLPSFLPPKKKDILIHPTPSPPPNGEGLCQVKIHPKQDNKVVMMRMRMMRMRKKGAQMMDEV
jgi:hypothetical protein